MASLYINPPLDSSSETPPGSVVFLSSPPFPREGQAGQATGEKCTQSDEVEKNIYNMLICIHEIVVNACTLEQYILRELRYLQVRAFSFSSFCFISIYLRCLLISFIHFYQETMMHKTPALAEYLRDPLEELILCVRRRTVGITDVSQNLCIVEFGIYLNYLTLPYCRSSPPSVAWLMTAHCLHRRFIKRHRRRSRKSQPLKKSLLLCGHNPTPTPMKTHLLHLIGHYRSGFLMNSMVFSLKFQVKANSLV